MLPHQAHIMALREAAAGHGLHLLLELFGQPQVAFGDCARHQALQQFAQHPR